jgi:Raf kinase inhibitor-like YbhB/YbcL family protein
MLEPGATRRLEDDMGVVLAAAMVLTSADFAPHSVLPSALMALDCGGKNRTPALRWSDVPNGTKSFALIVHDPDAPLAGGFYHWVVYDIPGSMRGLESNAVPAGARTGTGSIGQAAYYGPCPPPGPAHHYVFTLYALDVAHVGADTPLTATQLQQRIGRYVLAKATLSGVASHP